jgi:benzoyl-CoA reductase/2-hydroxyglutaryl-CoA dehydratase subunit BcrC/BadD/HgdB
MIVGENTCDGKKKAYESLGGLVENLYVMDLPQVKSKTARHFSDRNTSALKRRSKAHRRLDHRPIAERGHPHGQRQTRRHPPAFILRKADPAPISGLDALLANQVFFYDNPARFTESVNKICDELESASKTKRASFRKTPPAFSCPAVPRRCPTGNCP